MLINYRRYTTQVMIDMLAKAGIFYSRGDLFKRGHEHRPDVVTLRVAESDGKLCSAVIIEYHVYNNRERIEEILQQKGFAKDKAEGKLVKQWTIIIHHATDADMMVDMIITAFKRVTQDLPYLMYASPALKELVDYHGFMNSNITKTSLGDLMHHLGYWSGQNLSGPDAEVVDEGREYMVAQYTQGRWAAWVSGDLLVPLFESEGEARCFLKERSLRVSWQLQTAIREIHPRGKGSLPNIYVLADHTKSIEERLAWLYGEIDHLEKQTEAVDTKRRFAKVIVKSACSDNNRPEHYADYCSLT